MGNHRGSFALQLQIRKLFHSSAWSPISFFQAGKRCPSTKLCEIEQQIVIIKATFYFVKWSRGFRAAMLWLIGQLLCNCHTSIWPVRTQGVQMDSDIYYLGSESNASIASAPCLCTFPRRIHELQGPDDRWYCRWGHSFLAQPSLNYRQVVQQTQKLAAVAFGVGAMRWILCSTGMREMDGKRSCHCQLPSGRRGR